MRKSLLNKKVTSYPFELRGNPLFPVFAIAVLGILSFCYYSISGGLVGLATLQGGLATCQNRLLQSYTATFKEKIGADYTGNEFFEDTENCLSEAQSLIDDKISSLFINTKLLTKEVNQLQNEVHWFHTLLKKYRGIPLVNGQGMNSENISQKSIIANKFSVLESKLSMIDLSIEKLKNRPNSIIKVLSTALLFLFVAVFIISFVFSKVLARFNVMRAKLSQKTTEHLINGSEFYPEVTKELVTEGLELLGIRSLKEIWSREGAEPRDELKQGSKIEVPEVTIPHQTQLKAVALDIVESKNSSENPPPFVVNNNSNAQSKIDFDDTMARIVDQLAGHIFTFGINFNLDIRPNLFFYADTEVQEYLECFLLSLFGPILNCFKKENGQKKLWFSANPLDEKMIECTIRISVEGKLLESDLDMSKNLLSEVGGTFYTTYFDSTQISEKKYVEKIVLLFPIQLQMNKKSNNEKIDRPKLTHLFRGRKKDLKKEMTPNF